MNNKDVDIYAEQLDTQMRKGYLSYCVLLLCAKQPVYSGDIITSLRESKLVVVEGTIYPLMAKLLRDGALEYEWQESQQGPPRKYYQLTDFGREVLARLTSQVHALQKVITNLEKESS